jgi:response regulator NasT
MAMSLRILLADDESLNALALRAQLETLGHNVVGCARSGLEAVQLAKATEFDLAVLDIQMPGLSGIDAAWEIVRERAVPIILLTGHSDPDSMEWIARAPVFHFLVKPVSMEDLIPAIAIARSRFEEWQEYRRAVVAPLHALEDGAAISRAQALVMEARGISEESAEQLLRRESINRNASIGEIARTILLAGTILRDTTVP